MTKMKNANDMLLFAIWFAMMMIMNSCLEGRIPDWATIIAYIPAALLYVFLFKVGMKKYMNMKRNKARQ